MGIVLIGLFILVAGSLFLFIKLKEAQNLTNRDNAFRQNYYNDAVQKDIAGNPDEAIQSLNDSLKVAPSKAFENQIRMEIALNMYVRNQHDDRIQAIKIYKSIIQDKDTSLFQRAIAITDLLDIYQGTQDADFVRNVIFKGDPFEKFLAEARLLGYKEDVAYAARRTFEFAETLYPLAINEFSIAQWYMGELESGVASSEDQKNSFLSNLIIWTEKGEKNFPNAITLGYRRAELAHMLQMNALAQRYITKFQGGVDYSKAEELFKEALTNLKAESTDVHQFDVGLFVRLRYAGMLAEITGNKRENDIKEILKPIIAGVPNQWKDYPLFFYTFMRSEMDHVYDKYGPKKDIVRLVNLVPEFKDALARQGIHYE